MADDEEHQQHPSFKIPTNQDISIWRYLDLAKYLAILQRQSLFFARGTLLQSADPFEGSSTKLMVAERQYWLRNNIPSVPSTLHEQLGQVYKDMVKTYLLSCWHMNERESAAMWSLYLRSNEGVCIRSTYRRLRSVLPNCVFIGEVEYLDYDTEGFSHATLFDLIMHKRKSFEHERELRAVFWDMDGRPEAQTYKPKIEDAGLWIPVGDLPSLIEKVYVNPTAAPWLVTVIREVTAKYDLQVPVIQSALSEAPLY
jgi:hypothetical protein